MNQIKWNPTPGDSAIIPMSLQEQMGAALGEVLTFSTASREALVELDNGRRIAISADMLQPCDRPHRRAREKVENPPLPLGDITATEAAKLLVEHYPTEWLRELPLEIAAEQQAQRDRLSLYPRGCWG